MTEFIIPIFILANTGSVAYMGIIAATLQIPYLLFGVPAGSVCDNYDRKKILVYANLLRAIALCILFLSVYLLGLNASVFAICIFVSGTALVFSDVTDNAAFPKIVGRENVVKAASIAEGLVIGVELLAPMLCGLILATSLATNEATALVLFFDSVTFLFFALAVKSVKTTLQSVGSTEKITGNFFTTIEMIGHDIKIGLLYIIRHKELRNLAGVNFINTFLLSAIPIILIYNSKISLNIDYIEIGFIFVVGGISGLCGTVATTYVKSRMTAHNVMLCAVISWLVGIIFIAINPTHLNSIIGWAIIAFMMPVYFSVLYAHRVRIIPDRFLGKAMGMYRTIAHAGGALGLFVIGITVDVLGVFLTGIILAGGFLMNLIIELLIRKNLRV